MKLFLSWSGNRSRLVARALRKHLPDMLQGLEVFMSEHDLESGSRWGIRLAKELEETSFGLICLTRENLEKPWLLYEAGALTKELEGRACCLLIGGLSPAQIKGPLSQFQNRPFEEEEVRTVVADLNSVSDGPLDDARVGRVFKKWWPDLLADYEAACNAKAEKAKVAPREEIDLLEEILLLLRNQRKGRQPPERLASAAGTIRGRDGDVHAIAIVREVNNDTNTLTEPISRREIESLIEQYAGPNVVLVDPIKPIRKVGLYTVKYEKLEYRRSHVTHRAHIRVDGKLL